MKSSRPRPDLVSMNSFEADARRYLVERADFTPLKLDKAGLKALRAKRHASADALPSIEVGEVLDDSVAGRYGSIGLRRYLPKEPGDGPQPVIMFFHGGGWVAGDLDSHDSICRRMVDLTGMQVIAVAYRLAPEHPFPAAFEDAIDAHRMVLERAERWNVDTARIAVMGDGTGGSLAAVVSIHARDMCHPIPFAQVLFYPVTDMAAESGSVASVTDVPIPAASLRKLYAAYMPPGLERADWRASPLHVGSVAGLPPTFLAVGDHDPLFDEGVAFANRLYKAGITVRLRALPGQIHGYLSFGAIIAEASRSLVAAADFLNDERLGDTAAEQLLCENLTV
ncbi:alpha/beta hydrolase [Novosphingobium sp. BL-52-GroH]|uniref:alpha/beta hydrolase n=1 Tax=Novosphingobium sp. BL-52-GroH TaxID=3349877 RepID=UPI00384DB40B